MAIFTRRTLQRLIDENSTFLSRNQTKKHVFELNRMAKLPSLAFEWEVVVLNVFSRLGIVEHERNFGGPKNADIHFLSPREQNQHFVADIATVSDKGIDELNPFDALWDDLIRRAINKGINPDWLNLDVEGNYDEVYKGGPKVKLKLPGKARFDQIVFNKRFEDFINAVVKSPQKALDYELRSEEADLKISYNPRQKYGGGSHLDYTQVYSLTQNSVYAQLTQKANQLSGTGSEGPFGIILCDGGCAFFRKNRLDFLSFKFDDVLRQFLRDNPHISFVLSLTVEREYPNSIMMRDNPYKVSPRFYHGEAFGSVGKELLEDIDELPSMFPLPHVDASNALRQLKGTRPNEGGSHWGGFSMDEYRRQLKMTISARALLDLLSGSVSQEEFFKRHGFVPSELRPPPHSNPFERARNQGEVISEISIEKSANEEDDDWVTIVLRGPDPSISPFRMPEGKN